MEKRERKNKLRLPVCLSDKYQILSLQNLSVFLTVLVLVVGTPPHHVRHVLRLLVDRSGPENGALWRLLAHPDFYGAGFCKLAVQLI